MRCEIETEMEELMAVIGKFVKFMRDSEDFDYLISKRPTAFALLALIAKRAKRTLDHPDPNLEIGEAQVGDYEAYGVTEQIYRGDKSFLEKSKFITTKSTNKGTIAKIIKTSIFDINVEETQRANQHQTNDPPTTNKNDNNEGHAESRTPNPQFPSLEVTSSQNNKRLTGKDLDAVWNLAEKLSAKKIEEERKRK